MGFLLLSGVAAHAEVAAAPTIPNYPVTLTAYNAVAEQTDSDPLVTASGAFSNPEVVAARSQDLAGVLPFGTIIEIDGPATVDNNCGYNVVAPIVGYRVIADAMNPRYTNRIDILFSTKSNYAVGNGTTKNAGLVLGICNGATIKVVGHVNPNHMPKTQAELVAIVNGTNKSLAIK